MTRTTGPSVVIGPPAAGPWQRPWPGTSDRACVRCAAPLGWWETASCACREPSGRRHQDLLYAVACAVRTPLSVQLFATIAARTFTKDIPAKSAMTVMAGDRRFCWAGPGRYGLFRHGPLPGPRTLEEVSRLTLHSYDRPLRLTEIDHWLRGTGYEYRPRSLLRAVSTSKWVTIRTDEYVRLETPGLGQLHLRNRIAPRLADADWSCLRNGVARRLAASLTEYAASRSSASVPPWAPPGPDWGAPPG